MADREARSSAVERGLARLVRGAVRVPGLRRMLLWPVVARPGYWIATGCAFLWAAILGGFLPGRFRRGGAIHYFRGLPRWAFGRGGTTIGAIYLTRDNDGTEVLEHEAVHKRQWRRYGLAFIVLYFAAGSFPLTNRFEIEAGLEKGGYQRPRPARQGRRDG